LLFLIALTALAIFVITVFFFWGFVAASNSIFIPFCKKFFELDQIQSQLIGSAFYGAYF
jgi:FHS family L-fucose permease-like MFS transporter